MAFWNLTAQLGFLSFDFLLTVLFVFSSVEYSPVYLLRIPFRKECQLAFCIKKLGNLPISPGIGPPISGVDLVPTETAQLDLHGSGSGQEGKMVKNYFDVFLIHYFTLKSQVTFKKGLMFLGLSERSNRFKRRLRNKL